MEDYLQHMRTLRSQMNDFEDQAAKVSVEEQMLITTVQALENDTNSARTETKQLREDLEEMMKNKGQICSQILEKQRKAISLESDSCTLTETLELIQQEKVCLSAKIIEKRAFYEKVAADIRSKFQQQQDWLNSHNVSSKMEGHGFAKLNLDMDVRMMETEENLGIDNPQTKDNLMDEASKDLLAKLDSAKAKLDETIQMKAELALENEKMKQSIREVKCRANAFKPELMAMDIMILEEEHKVLLSDKEGETEYLQSLQDQIEQIKGISHGIKCSCGEEYTVNLCP